MRCLPLLPLLLFLCTAAGASAQARLTSCPRDRTPENDDELDAFVDAALAQRLQHNWIVHVWDGELVACARASSSDELHCIRAGRVDAVLDEHSGLDAYETLALVVPSARPNRIEVWSLRPLAGSDRVRVMASERRSRRTSSASPFDQFGDWSTSRRALSSWEGVTVPEADAIAHYAHAPLSRGSVRSVRLRSSRVLFFTGVTDRSATSVVAIVRDDGTTFRSCQIAAGAVGYGGLEDVLDLSRLAGTEAVGAIVRWSGEGYSYDLGYTVEIWSLVPLDGGGLAVSSVRVADWSGSMPNGDGGSRYEYEGWERRFAVLGRRRARLGPRIWRRAHALDGAPHTRRVARVAAPEHEADAPREILVAFDELGFVPPPPAPPPPREDDDR